MDSAIQPASGGGDDRIDLFPVTSWLWTSHCWRHTLGVSLIVKFYYHVNDYPVLICSQSSSSLNGLPWLTLGGALLMFGCVDATQDDALR